MDMVVGAKPGSVRVEGSGNDKLVPFDIDNGSARDSKYIEIGHRLVSPENSRSDVSVAIALKTLFFILVWYTVSTILTLYNKTLLGDDMGRFPAPLLMNTVHFTMQAVLSKAITWFGSQRFQPSATMSWSDYFLKDGLCLSQFYQRLLEQHWILISAMHLLFLSLLHLQLWLESPNIKLLAIILVISVGILLTGLKNPLTLMRYVTPVMAVATALLSLLLDPWPEFQANSYFNSSWHVDRSCFLMLFGGTLAFFMVLTEYILVSITSAVTVTIAGVVKEAVIILVAVLYFHDELTWLKGLGLLTIMVGVSLFNWYKYQKLQKASTSEDDVEGSVTTNSAVKHTILKDLEDSA